MLKFSRKGTSVSVILDRRRVKRNGMYPVKIEVVWHCKQKYFSTGIDMSEAEWLKADTRRSVAGKMEVVEEYWNRIRQEVSEMLAQNSFSFATLDIRMGRPFCFNINTAMRSKIHECRDSGKVNSYYRYRSTLQNLEKFAGDAIPFNAVTPEWLKKCEEFWMHEGKAATTVSIYMKTLKSVINKAMGEGYINRASYPFGRGGYTVPKGAVRKLALSKCQIKKLMDYRGPDSLEMYRDLWIFSYLCNGINFRDMLFLRYSNIVDGEICFIRSKTRYAYGSRKVIRAALCPKMEEIINRHGNVRTAPETFIFKFANGSEDEFEVSMLVRRVVNRCNSALRKIAVELDLPVFTTYAARHSFATVMQRSGVGIPFISECLGHSSMLVTENYFAGFGKEERLLKASLLTDFE